MNVLKRALLPLMFVVGFPVTSPACNQWDVTGTWHIKQGNGYSATVELSGREATTMDTRRLLKTAIARRRRPTSRSMATPSR